VDRDFDEPPPNGVDPDIEPTHTIRQLLEEYPPAMYHVIEDDVVASINIAKRNGLIIFIVNILQPQT
jgi:hypothetical protein